MSNKRAEIEAVRPFIVAAMREARHVLGSGASDAAAKDRALRMLNDALGRLDRVRDARGDDEGLPDCEHGYFAAGGTDTCPACDADALDYLERRKAEAARSSQSEDHELGMRAAQQAFDLAHPAPRGVALEQAVLAYLARVSPSRDGTETFDPSLSERERDAIEAMRTAVKIVGGEEPVPYDIQGMAREVVRLRAEVERLSSRDGNK